ncbi:type II toxin-antitoxin system RelE/ParE family toxin [Desulfocastanea catecholica]
MAEFTIIFTESYVRRAIKYFKKHPELLSQYEKCLQLMETNPFHPSLRLHPLRGKLKDVYSLSITLSYRLTIEFLIEDKKIIPIHIGTHDEVYS